MGAFSIVKHRSARRGVRGASLIEVMIVMTILVVAAGIFSRMVAATTQLRGVNRENGLAVNAARDVLELMRDNTFSDIFVLFNPDPTDDPGGAGTAPGHLFEIAELQVRRDSTSGFQLEVVLPTLPPGTPSRLVGTEWETEEAEPIAPTGGKTGKLSGVSESGSTEPVGTTWELREDFENEKLGFPRDLNGDSMIDHADHGADYTLLPVLIRVEWEGLRGPRVYEVYSMFTDYRKS